MTPADRRALRQPHHIDLAVSGVTAADLRGVDVLAKLTFDESQSATRLALPRQSRLVHGGG